MFNIYEAMEPVRERLEAFYGRSVSITEAMQTWTGFWCSFALPMKSFDEKSWEFFEKVNLKKESVTLGESGSCL